MNERVSPDLARRLPLALDFGSPVIDFGPKLSSIYNIEHVRPIQQG